MDPKPQTLEKSGDDKDEVGLGAMVVPCSNPNTASISLSLSAILPSSLRLFNYNLNPPPKISAALLSSYHHHDHYNPNPSNTTSSSSSNNNNNRVSVRSRVKIHPTHHHDHHQVQVYSSLSHALQLSSLSSSSSFSSILLFPNEPPMTTQMSTAASISANPLRSPLTLGPRHSSEPSDAAGLRRASIVWFRNDLRLQDNECLSAANSDSMSVLPVYCFDPRDYGKSSSGFDKTGPYRASFLLQSVSDLRRSLQAKGSDLVVRIGRPESVLPELAKSVGADAVYAHREVSREEVKAEEKIEAAMKDEGVEVNYFWGSTLYHLQDLPFALEDMPSTYGGFKEKVQKLEVRKTIAALDQLKRLPSRGDVDPGEIPSLLDLGLNNSNATTAPPLSSQSQDGKPAVNASMVGGETEALQKLKKFADECQAQPPKATNGSKDSMYGANFSCKISPWLAMGCLSPRSLFDELKKTASRKFSAHKDDVGAPSDTGMNWLMYELLWRDFFRFITKKYSSTKKQLDAAPVTACTGALA